MVKVKNKNQFKPSIAIPPGETLKEVLEDRNLKQVDFCKRLGLSEKMISQIINGIAPITPQTALKFESVLEIPASFWINLESNYQETKQRLEVETKLKNSDKNKEVEILGEIDYPELAKQGWVKSTRDKVEKILNLRKFFGVTSLCKINDIYGVAFRKAGKSASLYAVAALIEKGIKEGSNIKTDTFNKNKIKSCISNIRQLTMEGPEIFVKELKNICAKCGIALVILPHLKKTYLHGATKWLNPNKALLLLTVRLKYLDIFWFSFFHELGHILLHSRKDIFIDEDDKISNNREKEADDFASKTLIPEDTYKDFTKKRDFSRFSILTFAKRIGIAPCIVVGRLQHDKFINYSKFSDLKPRLIWKK
ncbi:MAG: HigA family addiction module antitoxin [Actinomycetota bacterium]